VEVTVIYTYPNPSEPIRQGDIFCGLPRLKLALGRASLPEIYEATEAGLVELDWRQSPKDGQPAYVSGVVRCVTGMVITQDCDAIRSESIALCEVRRFADVERRMGDVEATKSEKKRLENFVDLVTQHARVNQKWYYLPPDMRMGFERMAADFLSVFEIPREMLERYRETLRIGRLNDDVAWPHFRERVAEFFRRFPYNEWYPLTAEEVAVYETGRGRVERYKWQASGVEADVCP
jgi:hypothetical protein